MISKYKEIVFLHLHPKPSIDQSKSNTAKIPPTGDCKRTSRAAYGPKPRLCLCKRRTVTGRNNKIRSHTKL
ncbi:Uncharacterized protein TCM_029982 [Theobroma cacao]|uniref:Uncharacterized protein n=1 Tax=Theobroma cacao TaxID=3641 RepID=A0A061GFQ2_THECC|nr:Uncharacterized protein TCM_029982 [Theobroma cacao]